MEKNGPTTYYRKRNAYTIDFQPIDKIKSENGRCRTLFLGVYAGIFERLSYGILCAWLLVLVTNMVISRNVITIV